MHTPLRLLLTTAVLPVLAGCNLIIGADDYSVGPKWSCVGSVTPPPAGSGMVPLTVGVTRFTTMAPFAGATIKMCGKADLLCTCTPEASCPTTMTGADGSATISVPYGWDGYLDLTDMTGAGLMETLLYVSSPMSAPRSLNVEVGTFQEYKALVMSGNGTVDDTTGVLWVNTLDCLDGPASGVSLALDCMFAKGSDPFYFVSGSPVGTLDQTGADAIGGFADVKPGTPTLTATLAANGEAMAVFAAQVKQQSLTVIWLSPTPLNPSPTCTP